MTQGLTPDNAPSHPKAVGRYEVLLPIASGGMAMVYLARSLGAGGFEREVALKLTHAHLRDNREFAMDLIEEAKLSVRIRHPNVVSVLDAGEDPNGLYLVMDYVEGDTLSSLWRKAAERGERFPARVGLRILVDVLTGLHAAHELRDDAGRPVGLVHRDFSPQNILVGVDGNARLSDFGIAKAATRLGNTTTGVVKGKLGYLSPEQARGLPLDRRSDIWAAGVVAWETVAGQRLYDTENEAATILRIVSERPPSLRSVDVDTPEELDQAIAKALATDRQQRCATAMALSRQIASAAQAHGMLADVEEVARYVEDLIAAKLERRRARIRQVLASRASDDAAESSKAEAAVPLVAEVSSPSVASLPQVEPSPAARRLVWYVAGGAIAAIGVLALAFRLAGASRDPASSAGTTSTAATSSSASPSAPPADSSAPPAPAGFEFITISADVPIRSLVVDGREVPVSPPSRTLSVQVAADQLSKGVSVDAVASDGRMARVIGEAGQHALSLRFSAARGGGAATPGAATGSGKLPFAPNPYSTVAR
ncbi:MAG: serine/threonine protein kinase [Deltaproteobacteria bacterium]|nr:serine/threonine protein kinase [Deltaproteobacteria bacterium]